MAKVYDVPANNMILRFADQLKKDKKIEAPSWSLFVKTGCHVEKIPQNKDWWYLRCASLLRKIYTHGPFGVSDLRREYGGKKQIGYSLGHHKRAGGAIIRRALQQLENGGYIVKKGKGRYISDEGMKRMDRVATEIYKEIVSSIPELNRYA